MANEWITGHLELLYPSKYVKAADLRGKDVTVIVAGASWENLIMAGGKRDRKVSLHLKSVSGKPLEKKLIVGKTVLRQIAASLGGEKDVARWNGKPITIYPDKCRGGDGSQVECIRVRVKVSASREEPPETMTEPVAADFVADAEDDGRDPAEASK